jgi:hypothetical protein
MIKNLISLILVTVLPSVWAIENAKDINFRSAR